MTFFQEIYQKVKEQKNQKGRTLILDTCALQSEEAMQRIEEASKVLILTGTIKELDRHKNDKGKFGANIRKVCSESRKDEKSQKYVCVAGYEKYGADNNIIDYCREHKKVTILTSDNNLCNKAKAYRIPYLFIEREEERQGHYNIKGCTFEAENLYMHKERKGRYNFVLRDGNIIDFNAESKIKLEENDTVFQLSKKNNKVGIIEYEIVAKKQSNYADKAFDKEIDTSEKRELKKRPLPEEVKKQVVLLIDEIEASKVVEPKVKTQGIKDAEFKEGNLYLPKEKKRRYYFVFRSGAILDSDAKLEKGDIVFQVKCNDGKIIVVKYEIDSIKKENYAQYLSYWNVNSTTIQELEKENLPQEVIKQVCGALEETQEEQTLQKEETPKQEPEKELYFYKNWIRPNKKDGYKTYLIVEREGKRIKVSDYQEGDFIYLLRYHIKQKHLRLYTYEIIKENEQYDARKISENIIWYINEIYMLSLSEEIQEAIRTFYLQYVNY